MINFIVGSGGLSDYTWCPTFDELPYALNHAALETSLITRKDIVSPTH